MCSSKKMVSCHSHMSVEVCELCQLSGTCHVRHPEAKDPDVVQRSAEGSGSEEFEVQLFSCQCLNECCVAQLALMWYWQDWGLVEKASDQDLCEIKA